MTTVWTVGHWTCPEEAFIGLLRAENIEMIADVRSHPGSRRSPQFGREAMGGWLSHAGIHYVHLPALGGRRSSRMSGRVSTPAGASRVSRTTPTTL